MCEKAWEREREREQEESVWGRKDFSGRLNLKTTLGSGWNKTSRKPGTHFLKAKSLIKRANYASLPEVSDKYMNWFMSLCCAVI